MPGRTLTQHAAPTTFGAKAASWLNGVLDAAERLGALVTPVQIGGAAGTWAATTELAALRTDAGSALREQGYDLSPSVVAHIMRRLPDDDTQG